jgi:dynein heavy chain
VLLNIFQVIGELLNEGQMIDIDLGEMGKFCGNNRQILYDPFNKMKPQAP